MSKSLYRRETTILLKLIKECRTEAGLTQADFAKALDRPQSFVSDIERGSRRLDPAKGYLRSAGLESCRLRGAVRAVGSGVVTIM